MVDLGPRGILFMLLRGPQPGNPGLYTNTPLSLPHMAFHAPKISDQMDFLDIERLIAQTPGEGELRPDELPMLVTFTNIDDPKTVMLVDPNHLDSIFGSGARIVRATVRITSEPVTKGIEKTLKWLKPNERFSIWVAFGRDESINEKIHPERYLTDYDFRGGGIQ